MVVSAERLWKLGAHNSQTFGQLLMNFCPKDRHIRRGNEAQLHTISFNFQYNYLNVLANEDSLAQFPAKS